MLIKVTTNKIPDAWELIKFVATQTSVIDKDDLQAYGIELLHSLLSNKAQCWIRSDDDFNEIKSIAITKIISDRITNKKSLLIQNFYSFSRNSEEEWVNNANTFLEFAKKQKCSTVSFISTNPRIFELGERNGYKESYRKFDLVIDGGTNGQKQ